jgi:hypothetical protein
MAMGKPATPSLLLRLVVSNANLITAAGGQLGETVRHCRTCKCAPRVE